MVVIEWNEPVEGWRGYSVDGYVLDIRQLAPLSRFERNPGVISEGRVAIDELIAVRLNKLLNRHERRNRGLVYESVVCGYPRYGSARVQLSAEVEEDPNRHLFTHFMTYNSGPDIDYLPGALQTMGIWVKPIGQYRSYDTFRNATQELLTRWFNTTVRRHLR